MNSNKSNLDMMLLNAILSLPEPHQSLTIKLIKMEVCDDPIIKKAAVELSHNSDRMSRESFYSEIERLWKRKDWKCIKGGAA